MLKIQNLKRGFKLVNDYFLNLVEIWTRQIIIFLKFAITVLVLKMLCLYLQILLVNIIVFFKFTLIKIILKLGLLSSFL